MGLSLAAPEISARPGTGTGHAGSAASVEPAQSAQPAATLVVRGTIKSYDPISKILLLSTSNGTIQLTIPPAVRIHQHWHSIEASALANCSGLRAAVRYSESDGTKAVQSVHVFG
jgi:hypothetical protein